MEVEFDPSHYGDDGPVAPAFAFLEALSRGDYESMWALMDRNLQRCRAQAWLWNNTQELNLDTTEARYESLISLLEGPSSGPLWTDFAQIEVSQYAIEWAEFIDLHNARKLGAASSSRLIGVDLEMVVLAEATGQIYTEPTPIHGLAFAVVRQADRWLIASPGSTVVPTPGWPPVWT
jgi:hypothetical protein